MNSNNIHSSGQKEPTDTDEDAIPILDEALDLPMETGEDAAHSGVVTPNPQEGNTLMDTRDADSDLGNLGYADDVAAVEDNDDITEMEEIQTLPLAEMVDEDDLHRDQNLLKSAEDQAQIATLEAIVFAGGNPNAPAPKAPRAQTPAADAPNPEVLPAATDHAPAPSSPSDLVSPPADYAAPSTQKPLPKKGENPFLPQHILDRLNQGKRNLVEEIAQSSAALDASTAILRTHARAERLNRPVYSEPKAQPHHSFTRDKSAQQKQKIVDDLVEEYLPLIAAELRRRLRKILDE